MSPTLVPSLSLVSAILALTGAADGVSGAEDLLLLDRGKHRIAFSSANGSLIQVNDAGRPETLFHSGENGLWEVRFKDGRTIKAAEFQADALQKRFAWRREGEALLLTYESPELHAEVRVIGQAGGFDLQGKIKPASGTVLEWVLPARLRFEPGRVQRFVAPSHPHLGVGAAFNGRFFQPQPYERPSQWRGITGGPSGYRQLMGDGLEMRDPKEPPAHLQVTAEGMEWLGAPLAGKLGKASLRLDRPSKRKQVDVVLLDSPQGPFLSASRLGGKGALWRFGGRFEDPDQHLAVAAGEAVLRKLAASRGSRKRLGLVNVINGPNAGAGANGSVPQWREGLQNAAGALGIEFVELRTAEAAVAALATDEFLAILNPYGEWLPVPETAGIAEVVDAIGRYVRAGGNWFEVGGYPFYAAMRPSRFLSYESPYPPVFSDFVHLDSEDGRASVYGVQPRTWEPWSGAKNPDHIFVPGRLAFAGDEQGAWCERAFGTFVPPGQTWTAPVVRLALGRSAEEDIQAYCRANAVTRTLREKMPPALLERFRQSVLVKYNGNARDCLAALGQLPVPSLIHYTDYLKGGFDKEYPDHLPPNPRFGTPQEFREFHDRARAMGHLLMPYTNPTWWCDHPRGPSFQQAGEAPLLRNLDGSLAHEQYAANDGWTTCFWHPAVREANRKTVREFTEDYPVDLLLQDQCGARRWRYDLNPASPTPFAYAEGLLSMVEEDCRAKPLSTEDGWDRVVNAESQLCGFTFALGPGRRVSWAREMKVEYHPSTWELYPFVQRVAHDKAALVHHDLGKFVTDRPTLSWTLGLGFCMSYAVPAKALQETKPREWLRWLDRIQKSVCARYLGEPVLAFEHRQGGTETGDDGIIRAAYGPVKLVCNLSPQPTQEAGKELPGYGFHASAPGMVAGNLMGLAGKPFDGEGIFYVSEGGKQRTDIWVYAAPGAEVAAELPEAFPGKTILTLDGRPVEPVAFAEGVVRLRLPQAGDPGNRQAKQLWHAVVAAQ